MYKMYRYEDRIHCMLIRAQFWEKFDQLEKNMAIVLNVSDALRNSKALKQLLCLILMLGNFMNASSLQGGAFGMRITSINKLIDTKANVTSLTLLHVLTGVIRRQFPRLLTFLDDLKDIEQAARITASLNDMVEQYTEMRKDLKELTLELGTKWQPEDVELDPKDRFREVMTAYNETASSRFEDLQTLYINMDAKYKDAMTYYGENPKVMRVDDFFGTFARFVVTWKEATIAEEKLVLKQERDEKRKRDDEERKERLRLKKEKAEAALKEKRESVQGISTDHDSKGENDRNMMDNLLDKLRTGDDEVRTTRRRSRKHKRREQLDGEESPVELSAADLLKNLALED